MAELLNSKHMDSPLKLLVDGVAKFGKKIESVYLFGSRARGVFRSDSDYDILIVTEDKSIKDPLYDLAVDIFCETGADISLKIMKKRDFERLKYLSFPFIENVLNEGKRIA